MKGLSLNTHRVKNQIARNYRLAISCTVYHATKIKKTCHVAGRHFIWDMDTRSGSVKMLYWLLPSGVYLLSF